MLLSCSFTGNRQGWLGVQRFPEPLGPTASSHPSARRPKPRPRTWGTPSGSEQVMAWLLAPSERKRSRAGTQQSLALSIKVCPPGRTQAAGSPHGAWERDVYKVRAATGVRSRVPGHLAVISQASVYFQSSNSIMCFSLNSTPASWEGLTLFSRWGWVFPVRDSRAGAGTLWASDVSHPVSFQVTSHSHQVLEDMLFADQSCVGHTNVPRFTWPFKVHVLLDSKIPGHNLLMGGLQRAHI